MYIREYYCEGCNQIIKREYQGKTFKQRCETAKKIVKLSLQDLTQTNKN